MAKTKTTPRTKTKTVVPTPITLWADIERIAGLSRQPLGDLRLESLQNRIHGAPGQPFIRFLYRLAEFLKPTLVVELGTEWGVTAAHLCEAVSESGGHVVGVDDTTTHPIIEHTIPTRYPDVFTFILKHSLTAAPEIEKLTQQYGKIGLLFQDTRPDDQPEEWNVYSKLMTPGSVWIGNLYGANAWSPKEIERRIFSDLRGSGPIWVAVF